ncbi:MAG: hypothetical protein ACLSA2_03905 [Candidatus Gastranaerophilaceae bacterium]
MGMAASQARFLGLTARKTNVEYEGQQINQQRTTLSNQSANYYNQLLGMSVPVPPSVADYTKTVYTFEDGALSNSISSMIAQSNGEYLISYTSSWTDDFAAIAAGQSIVTRKQNDDGSYTYNVGAKELRQMQTREDADIDKMTDEELEAFKGNDEYLNTLSNDQLKKLMKEENEYIEILNKQYGEADWMVRYVQNTSTGTWSPYFCKKEVLDSAIYSDTGSSQSNIPAYTIGSAQKTEEVKGVTARLEQDASGRIINVTLRPGEADEVTYAVTTNTLTDQAKYDDAMNQYEYDKYQYDQSIQEINAKIEIIQSEDKNLELRLKQLDTEQDAISTEMDAVQKVIEKNTESTFKTFG